MERWIKQSRYRFVPIKSWHNSSVFLRRERAFLLIRDWLFRRRSMKVQRMSHPHWSRVERQWMVIRQFKINLPSHRDDWPEWLRLMISRVRLDLIKQIIKACVIRIVLETQSSQFKRVTTTTNSWSTKALHINNPRPQVPPPHDHHCLNPWELQLLMMTIMIEDRCLSKTLPTTKLPTQLTPDLSKKPTQLGTAKSRLRLLIMASRINERLIKALNHLAIKHTRDLLRSRTKSTELAFTRSRAPK